ncbi:MAG: ATP-binding protein [Candidatus Latescibacterota bacterium]
MRVAESEFLLEELELAYCQLERLLVESKKETDVTYQELQDKNRRLERQLGALQKAHLELKESQNLLVHSNRLAAMGQLAASVVHEIRNPLTVISLSIQLILAKRTSGDWELKKLNGILNQSKRLEELVNNMLSLSRKHVAQISTTNINTVLEELLSFLEKVKAKDIQVKTLLDEKLPLIDTDANQMQQVFMNLVMNAFDAMPQGGLVTIATKLVEGAAIFDGEIHSPGPMGNGVNYALPLDRWRAFSEEVAEYVCVEISDNGGGIPKEKLENIFDPFFTTKGEGKGTGLGLAICRDIVENHEGNIAVISRPKAGSTFCVFLPVKSNPER